MQVRIFFQFLDGHKGTLFLFLPMVFNLASLAAAFWWEVPAATLMPMGATVLWAVLSRSPGWGAITGAAGAVGAVVGALIPGSEPFLSYVGWPVLIVGTITVAGMAAVLGMMFGFLGREFAKPHC